MKGRAATLIASALLLAVIMPSCGTTRHTAGKKQPTEPTALVLPKDRKAKKLIEEAYTWLGTPYAYAKAEKGIGTDCSGMVMTIYSEIEGCTLPRNSAKQAEFCLPLEENETRSGDLVFFATGKDPEKISHVGLLIDSNSFIHASSSKGVVISELHAPYYIRTLRGFGRVPRQ